MYSKVKSFCHFFKIIQLLLSSIPSFLILITGIKKVLHSRNLYIVPSPSHSSYSNNRINTNIPIICYSLRPVLNNIYPFYINNHQSRMKFIEKFTYICVFILSFIRLHYSAFAKELSVCVDDEDFYFASFEFSTSDGAHVKQTCSWISDRRERIDQLCSIKTVQRACPMTCKTCSDEDVLNEHAQDSSSSSLGAPHNKSASMHKYTSVVGDEQSDDDDRDKSEYF